MNEDLRKRIVRMVYEAGEGHIPSAFSIIDILSVLYTRFLRVDANNPQWDGRDYFILSKGHGCQALYVVLERQGFLTEQDLQGFCKYHSKLGGHPSALKVPGVEASTGSLGHGLPIGAGIAMALKVRQKDNRVFVLIGDGECNEGTIWETAMLAGRFSLNNLICIVDNNCSAVLPVKDLFAKWKAFDWESYDVDGHSEKDLVEVFERVTDGHHTGPTCVIAHTVKGKSIRSIETNPQWHHKVPTREEYEMILAELTRQEDASPVR